MTAHTWVNTLNGVWYDGRVPTGLDLRTLDVSIFGALNGDGGSNGSSWTNGSPWTPASAIVIGGAGMWAAGPWTLAGSNIVSCGSGATEIGQQQITSIVNNGSGVCEVTVAGPYGPGAYSTGDLVVISGVLGTVEANGSWQITSLGGAVFLLQGSEFINEYVGGGIVDDVQSQITFGDNDYFVLATGHSAQSRTIVTPVAAAQAIPQLWASNPYSPAGNPVYGLASLATGATMDVPLRVHHGATIASATLTFFVGQTHSSIPSVLPGVRLVQVDMFGNVTPLATTANTAGTDASGMQYAATPASGTAWYDSGLVQTFTYTCDPDIVIDTTLYTYHAVIQDESNPPDVGSGGALTGNIYVELELSFTGITTTQPQ